jgi:hypothetical protein
MSTCSHLHLGVIGLIFASLLSACSQPISAPTSTGSGRIRAIASNDAGRLTLSLTLEGSDGQSLSGALVRVTDPGGGILTLPFDTRVNSYSLTTPSLEGTYSITTDSLRLGKSSFTIPVRSLTPAPEIVSITDGEGSSAQDFKKLKTSTPIRATWVATKGSDVSYLVEVRQSGKSIFNKTVDANSAVIPAGTIPLGVDGNSATVQVTAGTSSGDPMLVANNFFSTASLPGSSFSFQVLP